MDRIGNTDGVNLDSCKNALVENIYIQNSDDGICIKSGLDGFGLNLVRGVCVCVCACEMTCTAKCTNGLLPSFAECVRGFGIIYVFKLGATDPTLLSIFRGARHTSTVQQPNMQQPNIKQ